MLLADDSGQCILDAEAWSSAPSVADNSNHRQPAVSTVEHELSADAESVSSSVCLCFELSIAWQKHVALELN